MNIKERFLKYVSVHTTSDPKSESSPSSKNQWDLAKLLEEECKEIGLEDVTLTDKGIVMATVPGNTSGGITLGLIAHMDTAPDFSGKDVKPRTVPNYDGEDIVLNEERNIVLSPDDFPELKKSVGKELIVTDGTTLLGADDKAGVAAIMTLAERLIQNPDIPRGKIRIAFTPDEEVGRGTEHFSVEDFAADLAFTVDGGPLGEIEYRNFNAASAKITVQGKNIHPGSAKGKMINSLSVAMELDRLLTVAERPECTEGEEGFFHLNEMDGNVEETVMNYIIRDHDKELFEEKKKRMEETASFLGKKYHTTIKAEIEDSYYNMEEKILPCFPLIRLAKQAMVEAGVTPLDVPTRGGTDGAMLSYKGLPCPNLFTGGMNFHGKYEYIPTEDMEKAVEVLENIVRKTAGVSKEELYE